MNKLIREEVDSPFIFMLYVCVEASAFLVRHRRSGVLSEPWPLPEDETLGKVSPHLRWIRFFTFIYLFFLGTVSAARLIYCPSDSFLLCSSDGTFMTTAEHIRLPDDCTVGYIVEALLGVSLIRSGLFHSHLENLGLVSDIHNQVHTSTHTKTHCDAKETKRQMRRHLAQRPITVLKSVIKICIRIWGSLPFAQIFTNFALVVFD